jgi:hypothetical protein
LNLLSTTPYNGYGHDMQERLYEDGHNECPAGKKKSGD